ncbi:MAG: PDZ domain-containing protein [Saprospiraceae bacterium]
MKRLTTLTFVCLVALVNFATAQGAYSWDEEETAYLGIESNAITREKAKALGFDNPHGRYVTKIVPNSAAEKAGLKPFDYVYGINELRVSEDAELADLLEKFKPGEKVTLHYIRQGKKQTADITFVSRRTPVAGVNEKAYLGVSPHDEEDDEKGVKVYVVNNSTAEAMGMQDGDVIQSINSQPMVDWEDISVAINQLKAGDKIVIDYERDGKKMHAEQPIKSYAESKKYTPRASTWNPDERAFLGINSNGVSEEKAQKLGFENPNGSYITSIISNTAAEKAGLQPFDYVYGINDFRTNEDVSLTEILRKFKTGDKATIHFVRNGQKQTAEVTFLKRSEAQNNISAKECDAPFLGVRHEDTEEDGVVVEVVRKSTAEEMGLKDGDIVTAINGHRIIDWDDVSAAINVMKVGEPATVEYVRDGKKLNATKPVKSYCETRPAEGPFIRIDVDDEEDEADQTDENFQNVDINNAIVDVKDLTTEESANMQNRFGIAMAVTNDLRLERLNITPDANRKAFQLQFNLPQEGETSIRVYNAAGRMIYNYDLGKFSGDFTDQVNLSQNGAGNYFLEVRQGNKSATKKLILQSR